MSLLYGLPGWVPILIVLFVFLAWIYLRVAYPEDSFVDLYDGNRAVTLATLKIVMDIQPNDPNDHRVQWAARVFRNLVDKQLHANKIWLHAPHARLVTVRKGSLVFEYDIYILVTGSAIAVLKNYSSLKQGMKDLLDDASTIQRMVATAFRKIKPSRFQSSELRIVTEEEFEMSLRRFETSSVKQKELVREHSSTK